MLDIELGSFKTLENVYLKTTQSIESNGILFEEGETIARFDKILISGINELKEYVAARGGYDNRGHVFWETTRAIQLTFSQGVFTDLQFGLLNNAKVIRSDNDEPLLITITEELETNENGQFTTTYEPVDQFFVYSKETGDHIRCYKYNGYYQTDLIYTNLIVTYRYNYLQGATILKIGQPFLQGFLELEGRTRIKDDTSGLITTGIIKIPKLKLMSGLSMKLGAQASPVVGNFRAEGVPVDSRRNSYVMELYFLDRDIDSDM